MGGVAKNCHQWIVSENWRTGQLRGTVTAIRGKERYSNRKNLPSPKDRLQSPILRPKGEGAWSNS